MNQHFNALVITPHIVAATQASEIEAAASQSFLHEANMRFGGVSSANPSTGLNL